MTEPDQIGRYQIIKELGRGGMAAVYLARDPRFNRNVAIKVLPSQFTHDPMFRARFGREAQTIAVLEHPAIVPVHDFGEDAGRPFLVMRHMAGGSLSSKLEKGALTLSQAANVLKRIASALDHAHTLGIIHRDIKPANILFDQFGNAYLADFGIAKIVEATTALTGSDLTVGTPAYMSPEQVLGEKVDGRSDIYSLGVLLFEMLSGQQPYEATTPIAVAFKHVHEPIPDIRSRNAALPPDIQNVINKAMSKKRKYRFLTANKLAKSVADLAKQASSLEPTELLETGEELYSSLSPSEVIPEVLSLPVREAVVDNSPARDLDVSLARPQVNETKTSAIAALPPWVWGIAGLLVLAIFTWGFFSFLSENNSSAPMAEFTKDSPGVIETGQATETATDLPTHTPTSTSSPTSSPTQTPTIEPTEAAVALVVESPTATACPAPQLRVTSASVNVRSGPGTNYAVQRVVYAEDIFVVIARTENGSWYNVELSTDERGWISSTVGEITAVEACDITILVAATIPPPPLPTATPTPSPTNTPTPSPQPSGGGGDPSPPTNASPTPPQP